MKKFSILLSIIAGTIIFSSVQASAQKPGNRPAPNGQHHNKHQYDRGHQHNDSRHSHRGGHHSQHPRGNSYHMNSHRNAGAGYSYIAPRPQVVIVQPASRPGYCTPRMHCRNW